MDCIPSLYTFFTFPINASWWFNTARICRLLWHRGLCMTGLNKNSISIFLTTENQNYSLPNAIGVKTSCIHVSETWLQFVVWTRKRLFHIKVINAFRPDSFHFPAQTKTEPLPPINSQLHDKAASIRGIWSTDLQPTVSTFTTKDSCHVAKPKGSTPLIPKPAARHDPEPASSTSHPHNLFP